MKRIFVIGLVLLLTLSLLTGCKGKGNVSDNSDGMITEEPTSTTPMSTSGSSASTDTGRPSESMTPGSSDGMSENGTMTEPDMTDSDIVAPSGRSIR